VKEKYVFCILSLPVYVSDYTNLLVRIALIVYNHSLYEQHFSNRHNSGDVDDDDDDAEGIKQMLHQNKLYTIIIFLSFAGVIPKNFHSSIKYPGLPKSTYIELKKIDSRHLLHSR
jgi:hypothetical protein